MGYDSGQLKKSQLISELSIQSTLVMVELWWCYRVGEPMRLLSDTERQLVKDERRLYDEAGEKCWKRKQNEAAKQQKQETLGLLKHFEIPTYSGLLSEHFHVADSHW